MTEKNEPIVVRASETDVLGDYYDQTLVLTLKANAERPNALRLKFSADDAEKTGKGLLAAVQRLRKRAPESH